MSTRQSARSTSRRRPEDEAMHLEKPQGINERRRR
jgi:hypothetical protein